MRHRHTAARVVLQLKLTRFVFSSLPTVNYHRPMTVMTAVVAFPCNIVAKVVALHFTRFLNITINKCDLLPRRIHAASCTSCAFGCKNTRADERFYCLPRSHFFPGGSIGVPISLPRSLMPMMRSILPRIKLFGMPRPAS